MAEIRIIVKRGRRADLAAEIHIYEPATDKIRLIGYAGPAESAIDAYIRGTKMNFERAGNRVTVLER